MHNPSASRGSNNVARVAWVAAVALSLAAVSGAADASGGDKRPAGRASSAGLGQLSSADPAHAGEVLDALGKRGDRAAVETLAAFLQAGQPDALTDRALLALGETRSPAALATLASFTHHLRPSARVSAYTAAARVPGEAADALLGAGLRDSDAGVRGLCARNLAARGARSQLDLLFRAFARGVPEAAFAVGKLAPAAQLRRFEEQLGRLPIQSMLAGYEQFLLRSDIDEATKLELIAHLGEVASLSVKRFLEQLLVQNDWSKQLRVQRAIADTAKRIADTPTGKPQAGAARATPPAGARPPATAAEVKP